MKQEVKTQHAQSAKGLLSQAIIVDGFVFTSGFIHLTPDGKLVEGTTEDKFKQVMKTLREYSKQLTPSLMTLSKQLFTSRIFQSCQI